MAGDSEILVGGQAVLEGVMMKTPTAWAVSVRTPGGELVSRQGAVEPWSARWPVLKLPVLRGGAVLGQMMALGMRALFFSSDVMAREDAKKAGAGAGPKTPGAGVSTLLTLANLAVLGAVADGPDGDEDGVGSNFRPSLPGDSDATDQAGNCSRPLSSADSRPGDSDATDQAGNCSRPLSSADLPDGGLSKGELAFTITAAIGMFLLVFKALPLGLAWVAGRFVPALQDPLAESVISGIALLGVFVGYLLLMSRLPDIKRVFRYHGAEHQVVHVHERGEAPTVENAARHSTIHPRCGTSFLFFVVLTSIVVWSLFPMDVGFFGKLGLRLALFPLILGLAYELIRLSARHRGNAFFRVLMAPGLWSQRITTQPPDDSMRHVALHALQLASAGSAPAAR